MHAFVSATSPSFLGNNTFLDITIFLTQKLVLELLWNGRKEK